MNAKPFEGARTPFAESSRSRRGGVRARAQSERALLGDLALAMLGVPLLSLGLALFIVFFIGGHSSQFFKRLSPSFAVAPSAPTQPEEQIAGLDLRTAPDPMAGAPSLLGAPNAPQAPDPSRDAPPSLEELKRALATQSPDAASQLGMGEAWRSAEIVAPPTLSFHNTPPPFTFSNRDHEASARDAIAAPAHGPAPEQAAAPALDPAAIATEGLDRASDTAAAPAAPAVQATAPELVLAAIDSSPLDRSSDIAKEIATAPSAPSLHPAAPKQPSAPGGDAFASLPPIEREAGPPPAASPPVLSDAPPLGPAPEPDAAELDRAPAVAPPNEPGKAADAAPFADPDPSIRDHSFAPPPPPAQELRQKPGEDAGQEPAQDLDQILRQDPEQGAQHMPIVPAAASTDIEARPRVVVHYGPNVGEDAAQRFADGLAEAGFEEVELRPVIFRIRETSVRHFYERDAAAAARLYKSRLSKLASSHPGPRDFSFYRPPPEPGLLEVWLAEDASQTAAPSDHQ